MSSQSRAAVPRLTGRRCHCTACGEAFNSESTFDRHRHGDYVTGRRCLMPAELRARGWSINRAGFWIERERPGLRSTARVDGVSTFRPAATLPAQPA